MIIHMNSMIRERAESRKFCLDKKALIHYNGKFATCAFNVFWPKRIMGKLVQLSQDG